MSGARIEFDRNQEHPVPKGYILGQDRTPPPYAKISHLYKGTFADPGLPMCRRGWNRANGMEYSIWRGRVGENGVCHICWRRAMAGKDGVEATPRKTELL